MCEISRLERGQSEAGLEELRLERGRLALIEQRIREILAVLKSLNSMVSIFVVFNNFSTIFLPRVVSEYSTKYNYNSDPTKY